MGPNIRLLPILFLGVCESLAAFSQEAGGGARGFTDSLLEISHLFSTLGLFKKGGGEIFSYKPAETAPSADSCPSCYRTNTSTSTSGPNYSTSTNTTNSSSTNSSNSSGSSSSEGSSGESVGGPSNGALTATNSTTTTNSTANSTNSTTANSSDSTTNSSSSNSGTGREGVLRLLKDKKSRLKFAHKGLDNILMAFTNPSSFTTNTTSTSTTTTSGGGAPEGYYQPAGYAQQQYPDNAQGAGDYSPYPAAPPNPTSYNPNPNNSYNPNPNNSYNPNPNNSYGPEPSGYGDPNTPNYTTNPNMPNPDSTYGDPNGYGDPNIYGKPDTYNPYGYSDNVGNYDPNFPNPTNTSSPYNDEEDIHESWKCKFLAFFFPECTDKPRKGLPQGQSPYRMAPVNQQYCNIYGSSDLNLSDFLLDSNDWLLVNENDSLRLTFNRPVRSSMQSLELKNNLCNQEDYSCTLQLGENSVAGLSLRGLNDNKLLVELNSTTKTVSLKQYNNNVVQILTQVPYAKMSSQFLHLIKVNDIGFQGKVAVYIDGDLVMTKNDLPTMATGALGLFISSGSATFGNLSVTPISN